MGSFVIDGATFNAGAAAPGLHVVATPIGNLGDVTLRALKTLAGADAVAAEDTRHTGRMLAAYSITATLIRYDEHGAADQRPKILERLENGQSVALVSDAGTPLISDPGYRLVREARDSGALVHAVPGASAAIAALSVSGLPSDAFHFAGFLPAKAAGRRTALEALSGIKATLVLYEAPHRLSAMLADAAAVLGDREAAVARELTKRFETVARGRLSALAEAFESVKGEIVVLVAPPSGLAPIADVDAALRDALASMGASQAAAMVAEATGVPRKTLYRRALSLKDDGGG
ncbi:MAG: 16S rRNA (cytidine(1402)-2'-O)-methyltransferase [Pseudomonadota bacterium]